MQVHFHILNMLKPFLKFCNDCIPSECCVRAQVCSTDVPTQEVLVPEASEFDEWEPEGTALEGPVTAIIPTWQALTTLDLSHNSISKIDESVVRCQWWALGSSLNTEVGCLTWLFWEDHRKPGLCASPAIF